jgi:hypothetical protein
MNESGSVKDLDLDGIWFLSNPYQPLISYFNPNEIEQGLGLTNVVPT